MTPEKIEDIKKQLMADDGASYSSDEYIDLCLVFIEEIEKLNKNLILYENTVADIKQYLKIEPHTPIAATLILLQKELKKQ